MTRTAPTRLFFSLWPSSLFSIPLLFLIPVFFSFPSFSQGPPLNPALKSFPPSSYEEHSQVFCAAKGPDGGVWFGTSGHILYYNGETWEKFPTSPGMEVVTMDIDDEGRIWLGGTSEFGYMRVIPASERSEKRNAHDRTGHEGKLRSPGELEYVSLTHRISDSLRDFNIVWEVHALSDRVFFNAHETLFVLEKDSIRSLSPKEKFLASHEVNGRIWVPDKGKGLYRTRRDDEDSAQGSTRMEKLPGSDPLGNSGIMMVLGRASGMIRKEKKEVLILTHDQGLYRYRYGKSSENGGERIARVDERKDSLLQKAGIYHATALDPEQNPWGAALVVSTVRKGAILLDTAGVPVYVLDQEGGMTANYIWRTIRGAPGSGILWSTTNKGVTRWTPGDPRSFSPEGESFSGSIGDIIRHRGKLLLASNQGVYQRREGKLPGRSEWKLIKGTEGQCFDFLRIPSEKEGEGSLLVSGTNSGLFELLPEDGKAGGKNEGWRVQKLSKKRINYLTPLSSFRGREWIASGGRDGIVVLSRKGDQEWQERIWIRELPEEVHSLQGNRKAPEALAVLWVGLRSKGGFRMRFDSTLLSKSLALDQPLTLHYPKLLKGKEKKMDILPFTGKGSDRKGLPEGSVHFFTLQGRVLAGTDSGLYQFSEGPKGSYRWRPDSSLGCLFAKCEDGPSDRVQAVSRLQEAEDGSIWVCSGTQPYHLIPTRNGGYRIDSLPFRGMDLGTRSFYPESDGVTWIGGSNGLLRYDQHVEKDFGRTYPCIIREVRAPLQDTDKDKKDSLLFGGFYRSPAPEDEVLGWEMGRDQVGTFFPTLPFPMNGLTFRFSAPYFEEQEKLTYSHRLAGFDEEWSKWKKETRKEYTNLPEGSYVFKVKAKNVYGVESQVAKYRFKILPPWYRTWAAYGAYTVAGIGLIWLLLWLNSRRLIAQKQRLEKIVDERTKEIREQKEEVEKKNRSLEEANTTISKQKEEVEEQQKETERQKEIVEEAHREITASIDYAQKIQNALLQSEEQVSEHLPAHFILLKPQATVSGDFYWAREQNGSLYFAVVDCTGHGVPGAFMSMLGISQLNEIMAAHEEPSPGEVLTELRERVVRELSGKSPEEGAKDGMDAAMVKIPISKPKAQSPNSKKVEFAGANNPIYVVKEGIAEGERKGPDRFRNLSGRLGERIKAFRKSSDGFEIKGDKMAVGYEPDAADAFTTVELEVPEGAMLYLFSDGYADQFGGEKGKKFRYGPFKELLASIHKMKPEEQKAELDRVFEEWKAGQEQIDDVCVVGIRVAEEKRE